MGNTHFRSSVKEQTSGLKIAFSNASVVTATFTSAAVTNITGVKKFASNAGPLYIMSVTEPYAFTAATLVALASAAAAVNGTSLPKGTILTLASPAAPASNIWMKGHATKTASWINLTLGGKV